MRTRPVFTAALACLAFLAPAGAEAAVSLSVAPPFIEKLVPPGSKLSDAVTMVNNGSDAVEVSVDFADFEVSDAGEVSVAPPGTGAASLAPYLRVSPSSARVEPGQRVYFRYSLVAPEEFRQLRCMLYFTSRPDVPAVPNQVLVVPRMGVPLYVENRKSAPAQLDVEDIKWTRVQGPDGERLGLSLKVHNTGDRNIRPTGVLEAEAHAAGFNEAFEFNAGREPVLPGQRREWNMSFGPVPKDELALKLRFATSLGSSYRAQSQLAAAAQAD